MGVTRRVFLRGVGGLACGALLPRRASAQATRPRVVTVTDGAVWAGGRWTNADLDGRVLRGMLERALVELTGATNALAALEQLIPAVTDKAQRFGLKVNSVNPDLPTHPAVVGALAELMVAAGASPANVIAFDRSETELARCGYAVGVGPTFRTRGTSAAGLDDTEVLLSDAAVRFSRIVTDEVDHLINIPVLKNHQMAGVTLALKNHFGSIDRPSSLHGRANDGCPGIAELNAQPLISGRTRLVLIDATFATDHSGLGARPDFAPMSLVLATDPVAADAVGQQMVNAERGRAGLGPVDAEHIRQAEALGLGVADIDAIDSVRVELNPVPGKPKPWEQAEESGGCAAAPAGLGAVAGIVAAAGRALGGPTHLPGRCRTERRQP